MIYKVINNFTHTNPSPQTCFLRHILKCQKSLIVHDLTVCCLFTPTVTIPHDLRAIKESKREATIYVCTPSLRFFFSQSENSTQSLLHSSQSDVCFRPKKGLNGYTHVVFRYCSLTCACEKKTGFAEKEDGRL